MLLIVKWQNKMPQLPESRYDTDIPQMYYKGIVVISRAISRVVMALVNVSEAAERLKLSTQTVKRRLKNGSLRGEQRATPQGFVWLVDISEDFDEADSGTTAIHHDRPTDIPSDTSKEVRRLEEMVEFLKGDLKVRDLQMESWREQLEAKDRQLETRAREVQELHVLLQQAQKTLPAPKPDRPSWWRRLWRR